MLKTEFFGLVNMMKVILKSRQLITTADSVKNYVAPESIEEIPVSTQLTVQGTKVNVRTSPQTGAIVKTLNTGVKVNM